MDESLKQAFEFGQRKAEEEVQQKLKDAVKKREAQVGWKEQSQPPAKLTKHSL